jgi:hypothetical protein
MPERAQQSQSLAVDPFDPSEYGSKTILYFLRSAIKYRRIYWTWTDDIDPNLSFELA